MSEAVLSRPAAAGTITGERAKSSGTDALRHIFTIAKREISGYFASPVAYVFIVIFLLLSGFLTFMVGGFFERARPTSSRFSRGIRGSTSSWCLRSA